MPSFICIIEPKWHILNDAASAVFCWRFLVRGPSHFICRRIRGKRVYIFTTFSTQPKKYRILHRTLSYWFTHCFIYLGHFCSADRHQGLNVQLYTIFNFRQQSHLCGSRDLRFPRLETSVPLWWLVSGAQNANIGADGRYNWRVFVIDAFRTIHSMQMEFLFNEMKWKQHIIDTNTLRTRCPAKHSKCRHFRLSNDTKTVQHFIRYTKPYNLSEINVNP